MEPELVENEDLPGKWNSETIYIQNIILFEIESEMHSLRKTRDA